MLAVGTDVLNGRSAGETGDFRKTFDAGETFRDGVFDNVIPIFAAHNFKAETVCDWFFEHATHAIDDDYTVKAFVMADSVCAKAKNESREFHGASKAVGVFNVARGFDLENIAGRTAEAHSG